MDFNKLYADTPDRVKLNFLGAIIQHNEKLQKEFMAFAKAATGETAGLTYDAFANAIKTTRNLYKSRFESVDTENPDWDHYTPSHSGYIEEWEQYQEAAEQEFQEIFQGFHSEVMDLIIAQQTEELLAMLTGLYEAALDADVPDEVGSFESVNEFLLSEHKELTTAISEKLQLAAFANRKVAGAFELFFRFCSDKYPNDPHFAKVFEPVLLALAGKTENTAHLLEIMTKAGIELSVLPELTLLLHKSSGNYQAWLKAALQMYLDSEAVARELLQHYYETDKAAFVETAHTLFPANANAWAAFLEPYASPQLDKPLFVKVFSTLTIAKKDIRHYQKVKPYLDEAARIHIISKLAWEKVFLVKLLAEDGRYADIKALVEKETERWNFAELIAPILAIYPVFCFAKIKAMVENTLAGKRGRSNYERIATWLVLAKQIPGHEADAMYLIKTTYNHKPNLPALRDEMRRAGVV